VSDYQLLKKDTAPWGQSGVSYFNPGQSISSLRYFCTSVRK